MHPTELPILLELTPDVCITAQCTHTLERHHLSGDFQMSETRRKWDRLLHLSAAGDIFHSCSSAILGHLTFLVPNLICMLLLIANVTLRKTCINPWQSSVPKSRNCHYTYQNSSLHIRPTISLTSLSDTHNKASV